MDEAKTWCYFRNLTHTVYREARHVGPDSDREAKLTISDGPLLAAACRCSQSRARLKSQALFEGTNKAKTTGEVIRPYFEITSLSPVDLVSLFNRKGWRASYGGVRWAKIAELLIRLRESLDSKNWKDCERLCDEVRSVSHNSGRLVPTKDEWKRDAWLREKWPQLCD